MNLCIGSVRIPFQDIWSILSQTSSNETAKAILFQLRLPRTIAAAVLGGGLSLSGYLLQTYFHNPIAGPFILGISSGAKLVVAIVMVFSIKWTQGISSGMMVAAAFVGAMAAMGFVLIMASLVDRMTILLISGVMIGYICSAITDLIVAFADDSDIVNLHNWSKGSFSGITWGNVEVFCIVIFLTLLFCIFISKPIGAYQMGESYAKSLGVNIPLFRIILVIQSSLLAASVTAFAGPVSFVGVAVPHLVKTIFRSNKPQLMIPACFLGGGVFCMFCDLLARTLLSPTELSISTVTAIFGAPVVIIILFHRKERNHKV